eukprot:TRINITY_DN4678_c0_g1_i2.p1 TRINITY_DN4678_c0_g1~~TRINITY_DN4678_c0_g1_i2.p1  ORF type:complete len:416 (+),score=96.55 TRINITY_DN4678_c0_g1_i2:73-1320(+)
MVDAVRGPNASVDLPMTRRFTVHFQREDLEGRGSSHANTTSNSNASAHSSKADHLLPMRSDELYLFRHEFSSMKADVNQTIWCWNKEDSKVHGIMSYAIRNDQVSSPPPSTSNASGSASASEASLQDRIYIKSEFTHDSTNRMIKVAVVLDPQTGQGRLVRIRNVFSIKNPLSSAPQPAPIYNESAAAKRPLVKTTPSIHPPFSIPTQQEALLYPDDSPLTKVSRLATNPSKSATASSAVSSAAATTTRSRQQTPSSSSTPTSLSSSRSSTQTTQQTLQSDPHKRTTPQTTANPATTNANTIPLSTKTFTSPPKSAPSQQNQQQRNPSVPLQTQKPTEIRTQSNLISAPSTMPSQTNHQPSTTSTTTQSALQNSSSNSNRATAPRPSAAPVMEQPRSLTGQHVSMAVSSDSEDSD